MRANRLRSAAAAIGLTCLLPCTARGQRAEVVGQLGGEVRAVAIQGNFAYVGEGGGLVVIDISDSANPVRRGSIPLPDMVEAVAVEGAVACVLGGSVDSDDFWLVDVSNPAAPRILWQLALEGSEAGGVAVAGATVYVVNGCQMQILDVSNAFAPTILGSYEVQECRAARDITVAGSVVYLATAETWGIRDLVGGLEIVRVSNPASPVRLGSIDTWDPARSVAVNGTVAYVTSGTYLWIADVSDPAAPVWNAAMPGTSELYGVAAAGSFAYLAADQEGLRIVDASIPGAPGIRGVYDTPGTAYGVATDGTVAYVADTGTTGLRILDVSDPAAPALLSPYPWASFAFDVAAAGDVAYVAAGGTGLQIVDLSTPSAPTLLGVAPGYAESVALEGSLAYVAAGDAGLRIFDVTNKSAPELVGSRPEEARSVAVAGSIAYVASGGTGFHTFDVSNPSAPTPLGTYTDLTYAQSVAVAGAVAYIADSHFRGGLRILDVSDPGEPVLLASHPGTALGVTAVGSLAYIAAGGAGLRIFDAANPLDPLFLGAYGPMTLAMNVAVSGHIAYVADHTAGLRVLDVTDPAMQMLVDRYDTPNSAMGVARVGDSAVCVADGRGGLLVFETLTPTPSPSPTVSPSPSRSPSPSPSPSPTPIAAALANLSTRGFVGTGDEVVIAGVIVGGTASRRALISGIGPTLGLPPFDVTDALANPTLTLIGGPGFFQSNDDWMDSPFATDITATGLAPGSPLEPAIFATLAPGEYTAILSGANGGTGVGLVQAFDLDSASTGEAGRFVNISTRLTVGSGDRIMIGGFIVEGDSPKPVVIRALGPTIGAPPFNVAGAMADPELSILSGETVIATNANWGDDAMAAEVTARGLAPEHAAEAALFRVLAPGAYTAFVSGAGGTEGVALIEVYDAD